MVIQVIGSVRSHLNVLRRAQVLRWRRFRPVRRSNSGKWPWAVAAAADKAKRAAPTAAWYVRIDLSPAVDRGKRAGFLGVLSWRWMAPVIPIVVPLGRVLARFVLYTLSAGHPQLGGVDLDLAVEDDVFHSIRLTRMDDESGSNGKSSVAAICEISQAKPVDHEGADQRPGSGAGGKRWHPKQARFCPEETHVCSGHFGLTCDISDSDVINGVCPIFKGEPLPSPGSRFPGARATRAFPVRPQGVFGLDP